MRFSVDNTQGVKNNCRKLLTNADLAQYNLCLP